MLIIKINRLAVQGGGFPLNYSPKKDRDIIANRMLLPPSWPKSTELKLNKIIWKVFPARPNEQTSKHVSWELIHTRACGGDTPTWCHTPWGGSNTTYWSRTDLSEALQCDKLVVLCSPAEDTESPVAEEWNFSRSALIKLADTGSLPAS